MQHLGSGVPERYADLFGFVHARAAETRAAMGPLDDRARVSWTGTAVTAARLLADDYELTLAAIAAATCRGFGAAEVELLVSVALGHAEHPDFRPAWQTLLLGVAA